MKKVEMTMAIDYYGKVLPFLEEVVRQRRLQLQVAKEAFDDADLEHAKVEASSGGATSIQSSYAAKLKQVYFGIYRRALELYEQAHIEAAAVANELGALQELRDSPVPEEELPRDVFDKIPGLKLKN